MHVKTLKRATRTKQEQSERTRLLLIRRARKLFTRHGYAETSTDQILKSTKLTRGALYHQFEDKRDLFRAVCIEIHQEICSAIEEAVRSVPRSEALRAGCHAFLTTTLRPDVQQILIIDGPAVLGWEEWNRLDREHGFGLLLIGVQASGRLENSQVEAFSVMLNGALNEGVSWAARAENPTERIESLKKVLDRFLP
jgi:AcrR family transcriptional regulator